MRASLLAPAVAAVFLSTAASAATIRILQPDGTLFAPAQYGPAATFDNEPATPYGNTSPPAGTFTDGGGQFSGAGLVMNNFGGPSLGLYATPFGDGTNYMAVLGGSSEDILYSTLRDSFGMYWGSVDAYNSLAFYDGNTLVATVTGSQVGPLLANGGQSGYSSNGFVLITSLPSFNEVVVASGANSFEFDNVVAGVPEPSTWVVLMLGFVAVGYAGRRVRKDDRYLPEVA